MGVVIAVLVVVSVVGALKTALSASDQSTFVSQAQGQGMTGVTGASTSGVTHTPSTTGSSTTGTSTPSLLSAKIELIGYNANTFDEEAFKKTVFIT